MRLLYLVGVLSILGCQNLAGPGDPRPLTRLDDPTLSISEQKFRIRDRFGLTDNSPEVGPKTGNVIPGTWGRN